MSSFWGGNAPIFVYQTPSTLNQAAPAQNSWYALLGACSTAGVVTTYVENARVYEIAVNIEDANETLEVQAIVDGVTIPALANACNHSTAYYAWVRAYPISRTELMVIDVIANYDREAYEVEGRQVCLMVRKTTAAGAGNLTGIVRYGVKP